MQNSTLKMSRESRKLYTALGSLSHNKGVEPVITLEDIYISDMLLIKYYAAPIINIIKTRSKGVKWAEKHSTVSYWLPMISNMIGRSASATRPTAITPDWLTMGWEDVEPSFAHINQYVLTDYSYDDMVNIQRIVNSYETRDIINACKIGKANGVYEIRYINAVLDKEQAKKDMANIRRENLDNTIRSSDDLLTRKIHTHKRSTTGIQLDRMQN